VNAPPEARTPARTGRRQDAQVNPLGPQAAPPPPVARDPVRTFTVPRLRTALVEPHSVQRGRTPFEYSAIDTRMVKGLPQSWQTYA
jgi:hypothetical protein